MTPLSERDTLDGTYRAVIRVGPRDPKTLASLRWSHGSAVTTIPLTGCTPEGDGYRCPVTFTGVPSTTYRVVVTACNAWSWCTSSINDLHSYRQAHVGSLQVTPHTNGVDQFVRITWGAADLGGAPDGGGTIEVSGGSGTVITPGRYVPTPYVVTTAVTTTGTADVYLLGVYDFHPPVVVTFTVHGHGEGNTDRRSVSVRVLPPGS